MKNKQKEKTKIPFGMKIIILFFSLGVILYILAAIVAIISPGILSNIPNFNLEKFGKNIYYEFAGLMILFAIIFSVIIYGLIKQKLWAKIIVIALCIWFIIGGILSILEKNYISIINLTVFLIILLYLLLKRNKKLVKEDIKDKNEDNDKE